MLLFVAVFANDDWFFYMVNVSIFIKISIVKFIIQNQTRILLHDFKKITLKTQGNTAFDK